MNELGIEEIEYYYEDLGNFTPEEAYKVIECACSLNEEGRRLWKELLSAKDRGEEYERYLCSLY